MPKRLLVFIIILILPAIGFSQSSMIEIRGTGNNLYLDHTVSPKESFYSIGRLYNVSPRDLAQYNKLSMDNGLNIGQQIRIPLDKNNFSQNTNKSAFEALVPLYHTVAANETLFRIGVNYHNVPLASLKKWNQLNSDNVIQGSHMIVGYLRVNKSESALANQIQQPEVAVKPAPKTEPLPEPIKNTEPQKTEDNTPDTTPVVTQTVQPKTETATSYFKNEYEQQVNPGAEETVNGTASIFKSTSGWQDAKYYCFNNDAAPGSILKITIPESGKSVYAKVLDSIPDIKQNEGLAVVLSNSAADALGITDEQFFCVINFHK